MNTMDDDVPQAVPRSARRRSLPVVWIIPIAAALVGGWLAAKALWDRGPTIDIQFHSAEGIEAGKTKIRHKSVDVGTVRAVKLSPDNKAVVVTAEMDREAARGFLVEDTRFWVVRPRIAGGQVSGLSTLLAGSYIGADPGKSQTEKRAFVGLETPPAITSDLPGRQFLLRADDLGSLDINSPVYFRGVLAGRVVSTEVPADGRSVAIGVFVHAPFDRFVTQQTRFWNASGIDLALDASGVKLQTQSLVTLLVGGIAFESPPEENGSPVAEANSQFPLWSNRGEAMRPRETVVEAYVLTFTQSVRGLAVGAPVDFRGVVVGEVRRIDLQFDREKVNYRMEVEIHFFPQRMRSRHRPAGGTGRWDQLTPAERMQRLVQNGFRGQLRTANLLTGQLYVALDFFDKAPKAKVNFDRKPPEIPTVGGGLSELQESVANIVKNLEKVPFDRIAQDLRNALRTLEATLRKADAVMGKLDTEIAPELRATLEQARKTLSSAEQTLASDSPVQGDLRETLNEVTRAAESVRALADYLERHPESLLRGRRPAGDLK